MLTVLYISRKIANLFLEIFGKGLLADNNFRVAFAFAFLLKIQKFRRDFCSFKNFMLKGREQPSE